MNAPGLSQAVDGTQLVPGGQLGKAEARVGAVQAAARGLEREAIKIDNVPSGPYLKGGQPEPTA